MLIPKVVRREINNRRYADASRGGRMNDEQKKKWNAVRHYGRFTPIWSKKDVN